MAHMFTYPARIFLTVLTSMVLNSGTVKYVSILHNELIIVTTNSYTIPWHWPEIGEKTPKFFAFRLILKEFGEKIDNLAIPLKEHCRIYKKFSTQPDFDRPANFLNFANIIDVIVGKDDHRKSSVEIRSYKVDVRKTNSKNKMKFHKVKCDTLSYQQILQLVPFDMDRMYSMSHHTNVFLLTTFYLPQTYVDRQINLVQKFGALSKQLNFNEPNLFPWFMLGGMWNHLSRIQVEPLFCLANSGKMIFDSILGQERYPESEGIY